MKNTSYSKTYGHGGYITVSTAYSLLSKYYNSNLLLYVNGTPAPESLKSFTESLLIQVLKNPNTLIRIPGNEIRLVNGIMICKKWIDMLWDEDR